MAYKIAVCDDERSVVEKIQNDISSYREECQIDRFYSGEELLLSKGKYDIIFLDIDMHGMNGIETAKQIREKDKNVKIIYVTSYTDYVNYAFSVHAFAYLLKPIQRVDIYKQLEEAEAYYKDVQESKTLRFATKEGSIDQNINEIYYMEYTERHVVMKAGDQEYVLLGGISEVAKKMQEYMTADLRNHYTLQELSEKFEIPLTSMKVCFKGVYGCSIYAYMKSYRMQAATILLRDTSDSIAEIAAKMGYDNPSKFSEVFKKEFGELPSEFRKKLSK